MSKNIPPNFFSINSLEFSREYGSGKLMYMGKTVKTGQSIPVDTSASGAAAAWTRVAHAHDVFFVFCKRGYECDWREYPLGTTLAKRGIYALGKSESGPYSFSTGRSAIDVKIIALLDKAVAQFEINGNPRTYFATPYQGNRNDAIQQHPDATNQALAPHPIQGIAFMKMIVKANRNLKPLIISTWPFFNGKI